MKKVMKSVLKLKEERAEKVEAQEAMLDLARGEDRDFTDEEKETFDSLTRDVNSLAKEIPLAESIELVDKNRAARTANVRAVIDEGEESLKDFSLTRYISNLVNKTAHTGAEATVERMGQELAREAGVSIAKGKALPVAAIHRAISIGGNGSNWVDLEEGAFIGALRERMVTPKLGVQTIGGLQGDFFMPKLVGGSASWVSETGTIGDSGQDTEQVKMTPKRLAAKAIVSDQFLAQTSPGTSKMLADDLFDAMALKLDHATVFGGGTNEPVGVLANPDIGDVPLSANGNTPTFKNIVDLETVVTDIAGDSDNCSYLTNAKMRGKCKVTALDAGSGRFLWEGKEVNGYPAFVSGGVPSDLSKGTGSDLSAMVFGNFKNVLIGQWSNVLELKVDPYSLSDSGQVKIITTGFFDVGVRQPKALAAAKGFITA